MFAVVETGGKQYKVAPGDLLDVERLEAEPGQQLDLGRVLMVSGDNGAVMFGSPVVDGARVLATVVIEHRGDKLIVFKFKAKKGYRRKNGHRQTLTRIRIDSIEGTDDNRQQNAASTSNAPMPITTADLPATNAVNLPPEV